MRLLSYRTFAILAVGVLGTLTVGLLQLQAESDTLDQTASTDRPPVTEESEFTLSRSEDRELEFQATGSLEPDREVTLTAERSGVVRYAPFDSGDSVAAGQVLLRLDDSDAQANLAQAQAELAASRSRQRSAEIKSANSDESVFDAAERAETAILDAKENAIEPLFGDQQSLSEYGTTITSGRTTYHIKDRLKENRQDILRGAREVIRSLSALESVSAQTPPEQANDTAEQALLATRSLLEALARSVSEYQASDTQARAIYSDYLGRLSSARAQVSRELSRLRSAYQAYRSAQTNDTQEQIAQAEAAVETARVAVKEKTTVVPFSGTVARKDIEVGQAVRAGQSLYQVMDTSVWTVEVSLAEEYNQSLTVGTPVEVTVDGLSGTYQGTVSTIEPTVRQPSRKILAEISLPALPDNARAGLLARVSLPLAVPGNSYPIPRQFVGHGFDGPFVRTADGQKLPVGIEFDAEERLFISGQGLRNGRRLIRP